MHNLPWVMLRPRSGLLGLAIMAPTSHQKPPEISPIVQDKVTFDFSRENVGKLQSLALHRNALPAEPAGTAHQLPPGFGADGNLELAHFVQLAALMLQRLKSSPARS